MYWWRNSELTKCDVTLPTDHEDGNDELYSARKEAIVVVLRYHQSIYLRDSEISW